MTLWHSVLRIGPGLGLATWLLAATVSLTGEPDPAEQLLRGIIGNDIIPAGRRIPWEAVRVFVHEGQAGRIRVTDKHIAVDYDHSGVLFDRATGQITRRFTLAEGWPKTRPAEFAAESNPRPTRRFVGPGVLNPYNSSDGRSPGRPGGENSPPSQVAAEAQFKGRRWRAYQPAGFLRTVDRPKSGWTVPWSDILTRLNEHCYVEAEAGAGKAGRRFTTADGLASNIVTHLVAHGGSLYAACVDIYEPQAKAWGPGGLCRYDPTTGRWQRIVQSDGKPIRWVTLLETVGEELWVGYRVGDGVAGDQVVFGMGLYPGIYRPKATGLVLLRLAGGRRMSFARPPRPEGRPRFAGPKAPAEPSTEYPAMLARTGDKVMLFTQAYAQHPSGNWVLDWAGFFWLLDLTTKQWRGFDPAKDLDADQLFTMVADHGEILATSNRGVHRFEARTGSWRFLDPHCDLRNSKVTTAVLAGEDLWVGYGRQSFGVWGSQGISRFSERSGRWTYLAPAELGTASAVRRIVALPNGDVWVLFGAPLVGTRAAL
jgi:hypothetical protein